MDMRTQGACHAQRFIDWSIGTISYPKNAPEYADSCSALSSPVARCRAPVQRAIRKSLLRTILASYHAAMHGAGCDRHGGERCKSFEYVIVNSRIRESDEAARCAPFPGRRHNPSLKDAPGMLVGWYRGPDMKTSMTVGFSGYTRT